MEFGICSIFLVPRWKALIWNFEVRGEWNISRSLPYSIRTYFIITNNIKGIGKTNCWISAGNWNWRSYSIWVHERNIGWNSRGIKVFLSRRKNNILQKILQLQTKKKEDSKKIDCRTKEVRAIEALSLNSCKTGNMGNLPSLDALFDKSYREVMEIVNNLKLIYGSFAASRCNG